LHGNRLAEHRADLRFSRHATLDGINQVVIHAVAVVDAASAERDGKHQRQRAVFVFLHKKSSIV